MTGSTATGALVRLDGVERTGDFSTFHHIQLCFVAFIAENIHNVCHENVHSFHLFKFRCLCSEEDIDECLSNPCRNYGECSQPTTTDDAGQPRPVPDQYQCTCQPGWGGQRCQTNIDDCASEPCDNGGDCTDRVDGYQCACLGGFQGDNCDVDIDECASLPCLNGAECNDGVESWSCSCATGFTGQTCQENLDDCVSTPCQNDAVCRDGSDAYACSCRSGFDGGDCETEIDGCDASLDPCDPINAVCISVQDSDAGFACQCFPGFSPVSGPSGIMGAGSSGCVNIDDCINEDEESVCLNSGTCQDHLEAFTCECATGFQGLTCEQNIDDCMSSPCGEFGTCTDANNAYTCECGIDWYGDRCEQTDLTMDCAGTLGGTMILDDCDVCGPVCTEEDASQWAASCPGFNTCADCAGTPYGRARVDPCGMCVDGGYYSDNCVIGCDDSFPNLAANADARAVLEDQCGVCGGSNECLDCAGVAITRDALDRGVVPSLCDACGTCDGSKGNDCGIDCNGVYMCASTFAATSTGCPAETVDGAECFVAGSGAPDFSSVCFSQGQCDAMPTWADTDTHLTAAAASVDTCGVCAGDGTSCLKDYVKVSFSRDLSTLQTQEELDAYKIELAAQLGVDPSQLSINLPDQAGAGGGRRLQDVGGIDVVIESLVGESADSDALTNSLSSMEGVEGVEAEVLEVDCRGVAGGTTTIDVCGLCGGDGTTCLDCNNVANGPATLDRCDTCDETPENDCVQDCQATWGGDVFEDVCGVCGGDGSSCLDCAGGPGRGHVDFVECSDSLVANGPDEDYTCGAAAVDSCGVCDKDSTNDCVLDCAGEWGGTQQTLSCVSMSGGETSVCGQSCPPVDCVGAWTAFSDCRSSDLSEVVVCGGGTKTRTFEITRAASGQGAVQCVASSAQEDHQECATQPCMSFAYYAEDFLDCPTDCGLAEVTQTRELRCNEQPAGVEANGASCLEFGARYDEVAMPLRNVCAETDACPEKDLEAARVEFTLGGDIASLAAGSDARDTFEETFKSDVARVITAGMDEGQFLASQITIVSIAPGSILVTFDVSGSDAIGEPTQVARLIAGPSWLRVACRNKFATE